MALSHPLLVTQFVLTVQFSMAKSLGSFYRICNAIGKCCNHWLDWHSCEICRTECQAPCRFVMKQFEASHWLRCARIAAPVRQLILDKASPYVERVTDFASLSIRWSVGLQKSITVSRYTISLKRLDFVVPFYHPIDCKTVEILSVCFIYHCFVSCHLPCNNGKKISKLWPSIDFNAIIM